MRRRIALLAAGLVTAGVVGLAAAPAQAAHPLGNFSVNELVALDLRLDQVLAQVDIDIAELPSLQDKAVVDRDRDGSVSPAEGSTYAAGECERVAAALPASVDGQPIRWKVGATSFAYQPGAAGLPISRLRCALSGAARLAGGATVSVTNTYRADRIGWREMTAVASGVHLVDSALPTASVSNGLRSYPADLLSTPMNVRSATLRVAAGGSTVSSGATSSGATGIGNDRVWYERLTATADRALQGLVGGRLTVWVGLLAVFLAVVLGAGHAALPGHGKTIMAMYLAGKQGRRRDAVTVGATVTATHTGGVIVLGLLITSVTSLAGQRVLGWLGVASGILVTAVGASLLWGLRRRLTGRPHASHQEHAHDGNTHRHHDHGHHDHGHDDDHAHHDDDARGHRHAHQHRAAHQYDHAHPHDDPHPRARDRRWSLVGMGIAGGLVPSPSALVVLLAAIGLGRTWFGVLLVIAYGLGMAGTLAAAGLLLLTLQDRWQKWRGARWERLSTWLARATPATTASLVVLVGLGLAGRALAGLA